MRDETERALAFQRCRPGGPRASRGRQGFHSKLVTSAARANSALKRDPRQREVNLSPVAPRALFLPHVASRAIYFRTNRSCGDEYKAERNSKMDFNGEKIIYLKKQPELSMWTENKKRFFLSFVPQAKTLPKQRRPLIPNPIPFDL